MMIHLLLVKVIFFAAPSWAAKDICGSLESNKSLEICSQKNLNAKKGHTIFKENCVNCHGPNGKGDGPVAAAMKNFKPRNFHTDKFKNGESNSNIFCSISEGIPGSPMPPWKHSFSKEQRCHLVAFIQSLRKDSKKAKKSKNY